MAWVEQAHALAHHQRDTLHPNDAEQVDGQAARDGGGQRAHQGRQLGDEAEQHGDDAGGEQDRTGVVAANRHERVVLAVVGAWAGAEQAVHRVGDAVENQVEANELAQADGRPAHLLSQAVHVQANLVQVGRRLRNGGDGDGGDGEDGEPRLVAAEGGQLEGRDGEQRRLGDGVEADQAQRNGDHIADGRAEQHRQHPQQAAAAQVDREDDGGEKGNGGDDPPRPAGDGLALSVLETAHARGHVQRRLRQGDADDNGDRAGDNGRQEAVEAFLTGAGDEQTDQNIDKCGADDADLGDGRAVVLDDSGRDGDIAEAGPIIQGDVRAAGEVAAEQRDNGRCARGKERYPNIEPNEDGAEDGGREHGDDVLEAQAHQRARWGRVLGQEALYTARGHTSYSFV